MPFRKSILDPQFSSWHFFASPLLPTLRPSVISTGHSFCLWAQVRGHGIYLCLQGTPALFHTSKGRKLRPWNDGEFMRILDPFFQKSSYILSYSCNLNKRLLNKVNKRLILWISKINANTTCKTTLFVLEPFSPLKLCHIFALSFSKRGKCFLSNLQRIDHRKYSKNTQRSFSR